ncbi:TPA: MFS transporter [Legionella pneumophila]|uniref:MFS transporter n=1 Tax=Legionella pneumophila TaxID=446 RepID=UPI000777554F|nr:MFS transporter [Legionella pneumophila]HAT8647496.1 MFS transporter [Legionella pneumophila]HAU0838080.1 multidrug effflux MFS transporter [Legionella pneumophila]HAU0882166.1 multidrug effflux MFS transporter [Legionella pneumophila]
MNKKSHLSFLTLLLMISFASVNAVLFTPALPAIANFFAISDTTAQLTITWFLIGYALGQLLYGPLANRFGRKPALYAGIILQILSSLLCVLAGFIHSYFTLVLGRLLLALGSGVGLKMTFTLVNETYEPIIASQKLSYLMIAFAITPGLGIMIGGYLSPHFSWMSTFFAGAVYGVILLLLAIRLPETRTNLDFEAFKMKHLINGYITQFKNLRLIAGGLLMGGATCFVYLFAALAPFIAINKMHMEVSTYGTANLLPPIGLVMGSLVSAQLSKVYKPTFIIAFGIFITLIGSIMMSLLMVIKISALLTIFIPMMLCYFGLSLVFANASIIAMSNTSDKAHGSAVMNFINMGLVTIVVLSVGMLSINNFILPAIYIVICIFMAALLYVYQEI